MIERNNSWVAVEDNKEGTFNLLQNGTIQGEQE